ncbi:hypothetical protein BKA66DRAFT_565585 [Pyrenochaeta sp. MPI-SDFR-AT-0127]|nr:hypothetical protein BKA66DRAFT_565585 [Pyrenochaeta sp. MPI-SDFR-AT-0127]
MAPRKPSARNSCGANLSKTTTAAGIAKHHCKKLRFFENGLLDVTRKGGKYFKIARQNQRESPLLRLPPEIRNQIFEIVLGGRVFELEGPSCENPNFVERSQHVLALLAVCRQIYAETSLLPFKLNTFSAWNFSKLNDCLNRMMKQAHVDLITYIQLKSHTVVQPYLSLETQTLLTSLLVLQLRMGLLHQPLIELKSLRHVHVLVEFGTSFCEGTHVPTCASGYSERWLKEMIQSTRPGVEVTIQTAVYANPTGAIGNSR